MRESLTELIKSIEDYIHLADKKQKQELENHLRKILNNLLNN